MNAYLAQHPPGMFGWRGQSSEMETQSRPPFQRRGPRSLHFLATNLRNSVRRNKTNCSESPLERECKLAAPAHPHSLPDYLICSNALYALKPKAIYALVWHHSGSQHHNSGTCSSDYHRHERSASVRLRSGYHSESAHCYGTGMRPKTLPPVPLFHNSVVNIHPFTAVTIRRVLGLMLSCAYAGCAPILRDYASATAPALLAGSEPPRLPRPVTVKDITPSFGDTAKAITITRALAHPTVLAMSDPHASAYAPTR